MSRDVWTAIAVGLIAAVGALALGLLASFLSGDQKNQPRPGRSVLAAVALFAVGVLAGAVAYYIETQGTQEVAATDRNEINCPVPGTGGVPIEGSLGVANQTAGDTEWKADATVSAGDTLKFQVYLRNLALDADVQNLKVQLLFDEAPADNPVVILRACGTNTEAVRDLVNVRGALGPVRLVPEPGTVIIRAHVNGEAADRGGSDDVYGPGESLGTLVGTAEAFAENTITLTVRAVVTTDG